MPSAVCQVWQYRWIPWLNSSDGKKTCRFVKIQTAFHIFYIVYGDESTIMMTMRRWRNEEELVVISPSDDIVLSHFDGLRSHWKLLKARIKNSNWNTEHRWWKIVVRFLFHYKFMRNWMNHFSDCILRCHRRLCQEWASPAQISWAKLNGNWSA